MEDLGDEYRRLESYVKTLLNNQLKEILKREGLAVTGVKAVLQSRIMESKWLVGVSRLEKC